MYLDVERAFDFAILFILGQPSLTVECKRFIIDRIDNLDLVQKPGRSKHGVVVTYLDLEDFAKVNSFNGEDVDLSSLEFVGMCFGFE